MRLRLPKFGKAMATVAVLLGAFTGVSAYTFYYGEGGSYLSSDPRACVNCHIMRPEYDGWQKASHHGVATCNDCHLPHDFFGKWWTKVENGYLHSKAFTFQDFHEPIRMRPRSRKVLLENCVDCHRGLVGELVGYPEHVAGDEAPDCLRCHASVGHGPPR